MPTISKKQLQEYEHYKELERKGQLLTPEGLRMICNANDNNPTEIGKHILECLVRVENKR